MPAFVIGKKGGRSSRQVIDRNEITIGRGADNDIVLASGAVSRRHARIVCEGTRVLIVDLRTSNGTHVNGRRIDGTVEIGCADKVYIGDFIVQLEGESTSAAEAPPDAGRPRTVPEIDTAPADLLRCGNCNGPLDAPDPSRPTISCPYCGFQTANRLYGRR